jgi:hypothetical protein
MILPRNRKVGNLSDTDGQMRFNDPTWNPPIHFLKKTSGIGKAGPQAQSGKLEQNG